MPSAYKSKQRQVNSAGATSGAIHSLLKAAPTGLKIFEREIISVLYLICCAKTCREDARRYSETGQ
jgi:hypothetical protein